MFRSSGGAFYPWLVQLRRIYVFKLTPRLKYRELRESDVQRLFGIATPDTLVRLQVLQGIFAASNER
jgi:hypothetical protein